MGFYITSGVLAFFYWHLRPIIEAGRLFKVYSPLYRLDDDATPYATNKSEYVEIYHKKIVKTYKVRPVIYDDPMDKDEMWEFLEDTYEYRESLIRAAQTSGKVDKYLLECIVYALIATGYATWIPNEYDSHSGHIELKDREKSFSDKKFLTAVMKIIHSRYKEIQVANGYFFGVVHKDFARIDAGNRLFKKSEELVPALSKYGYLLEVENRKTGAVKVLTIGEFLDHCRALVPEILDRIKGIGELNAEDLWKASMDINHRLSIQFTVDDVERELGIFHMTHGGTPEDAANRKKMMKDYHIKRDDLDN